MTLLMTMSLFGSIGTICYLISLLLAQKYLSVQWRRYYLICNILEYLVPLPCLHVLYRELLERIWRKRHPGSQSVQTVFTDYTADVIQIAPGRIQIPNAASYVLATAVFIIGTGVFCCWIQKYRRIKRFLRTNTESVSNQVCKEIVEECRYAYQKTLRVYQCALVNTPFTIGIFQPVIVLPDREWSMEDLKMVIEHEAVHIRQCDNMVKMLGLVMLALNFYNPLAWYVMYQWNAVAELSCDRKVIVGKTREEIKRYGLLAVEMAENHIGNMNMPLMGFNIQNKIMKERICQMKNGVTKGSVVKNLIGIGVMGVAVLASSLSVFAYSPKYIEYSDDIVEGMYFSEKDVRWGDIYADLPVNKNDGWVFWEDGAEKADMSERLNPDAEMYSICVHDYVSGHATKHTKYSDSSCKIDYYNAEKCSKCGKVVLGELINTLSYGKCPH